MKTPFLEKLLYSRKTRLARLKQRILTYLETNSDERQNKEYAEVADYLKDNEISVFPYPFASAYQDHEIAIELDTELKLYYTKINGRKLYYKNGTQRKKAIRYFKSIIIEQDKKSPHCYLSDDFQVSNGDIVFDVGAAEGNFSLSVIDKAEHIYLFEPDSNWNKALEATFKPWNNKVTIVNKYVSDKTDNSTNTICIDDYAKDLKVNFIKADVEGFESSLLRGASSLLKTFPIKVAICTYHNQEDAEHIKSLLSDSNFECNFTPGYMLYYYGKSNIVKEPYLRRGVLRATKAKHD